MDSNKNYNTNRNLENQVWKAMYIRAEEWQRDLDFLKDEFGFLHNLIGGYLVWLEKEDSLPKIQGLIKRLNELQNFQAGLTKKITMQLITLEELLNNSFKGKTRQVKNEDITLNKLMKSHTNNFRALKKEVYVITKEVGNIEKLKQLKTT
jgi:hypothetical protein